MCLESENRTFCDWLPTSAPNRITFPSACIYYYLSFPPLNILICFDLLSVLGVFSCPLTLEGTKKNQPIAFLRLGCVFLCPWRQHSFRCIRVGEDESGVERTWVPWCIGLRMRAALLSYPFGSSSGRPRELSRVALNSLSQSLSDSGLLSRVALSLPPPLP